MDQPEEQTTVPTLSRREHRFLWLTAHGYTASEAGQAMGTRSVFEVSTRVRHKLQARTLAQAVYRGLVLGVIGDYESCGLISGYRAHQVRKEPVCRACRRVFTEYMTATERAALIPQPPLAEPELRLLKALDAGRTFQQVAANWDLSRTQLERVRASLYRKLDVSHLPGPSRYQAALDEGRRRGLLAPRGLPREVKRRINKPRPNHGALTDLQVRVLAATVGRSLSEAGAELGFSAAHVSSHLARIYAKLDVLHHPHGERREAAIKAARERGHSL